MVFVTCRGGGLTVLDVSDPLAFCVARRWETQRPVEGQDRLGSTLVVVEMGGDGHGHRECTAALHVFDLSRASRDLHPVATIDLSSHVDGLLHVKLYTARDGRLWAICSGGFGRRVPGAVVAVDIHGDAHSTCVLPTPVRVPEGVGLVGDFAYIGGVGSTAMAVVDISDPMRMRLVSCEVKPGVGGGRGGLHLGGSQLVPARSCLAGGNHIVQAVWGAYGGLAVLDVSQPAKPREVGRCVSARTSFANRVTLDGGIALLPLELPIGGGFAIVDVSNPTSPHRLCVVPIGFALRDRRTYCLALSHPKGADGSRFVHLFEAKAARMLTYELHLPSSRQEAQQGAAAQI